MSLNNVMELKGPKFCTVDSVVEFQVIYLKKNMNISFRVVDPKGKESVPMINKSNDISNRVLSFQTSTIGFYRIIASKNNSSNILVTKECFAFNLEKERWEMNTIHWNLDRIDLIMEMRRHHQIAKYISAQAHLLSDITNSPNPNVVIKCNVKISSDKSCKFYFTPPQFGSYEIRFFIKNASTSGPRPKVHVTNIRRWKLIHSFTTTDCLTSLNKKASFIFELSGSPSEYLKAWVECPNKNNIDMLLYGEEKNNKIGQLRCDFTPTIIGLHSLFACYKDALFDKCPLQFHVYDSSMVEIISIEPDILSKSSFAVGEVIKFTYNCLNGWPEKLEMSADVADDSGIYSSVYVDKSVNNVKGIVTFSVKLPFAGRYLLESFYNEEKINTFEIEAVLSSKNNHLNHEDPNTIESTPSQELRYNEYENPMSNPIELSSEGSIITSSEETFESILISTANDAFPVVTGEGLKEAIVEETAVFIVDQKQERGKLTVDVTGPKSLEKCLIKPDSIHSGYEVEYYPKEIGLYQIAILWNESPLPGSPFKVEATDPKSIQCISHDDIFNNILRIPTGRKTKIEFSYSLAGNGRMSASVKQPNESSKSVKTWTTVTKSIWAFWIQTKEKHKFDVNIKWNSRIVGTIKVESERYDLPPEMATDPASQIIIKGRGIRESWVGETSRFMVDAFNVENGSLVVQLRGMEADSESIPVIIEKQPNETYVCQYQATTTGQYLLNISWGEQVVKGSPFLINVKSRDPATGVECQGEGLKHGFVGEIGVVEIKINTSCKNLSEKHTENESVLSVSCKGPDNNQIMCNLLKKSSSYYLINLKPQISGRHTLDILYGDTHVPGSPFYPFYTDKECLEKLRVYGPGLKSSHLKDFESYFTVDTREVGVGKLRVQVKGPKEAFRVEVQKNPTDNRLIKCSFNPTEVGEYTISVSWSGCPVKESPFKILLD